MADTAGSKCHCLLVSSSALTIPPPPLPIHNMPYPAEPECTNADDEKVPNIGTKHGTVSFSDGNFHDSVATFICDSGYVLSGTSATIQCDASGSDKKWPPAPVCVGECSGLP